MNLKAKGETVTLREDGELRTSFFRSNNDNDQV